MHKTILLFIFSFLLISACSNSKNNMANNNDKEPEKTQPIENKKQEVNFEQLTFNENGSGLVSKNLVLQHQDKFEMTWKMAHQNMSPIPAVPSIDFENESVLFIDFGSNSHGGIDYDIENILLNKDTLEVSIKKPAMDDNMLVTTVMTRPFMFIKIDKTSANQVVVK